MRVYVQFRANGAGKRVAGNTMYKGEFPYQKKLEYLLDIVFLIPLLKRFLYYWYIGFK